MIDGTLVSLRAREPTDAATILPWLNDPEVKRYLGGRYPWSLAAEQEWLRQRTAKPIDFNELSLVIETRDGRAIGTVGLGGITPENREATLGITIGAKDCWSRGYGTDATHLPLDVYRGASNQYVAERRHRRCRAPCGHLRARCGGFLRADPRGGRRPGARYG